MHFLKKSISIIYLAIVLFSPFLSKESIGQYNPELQLIFEKTLANPKEGKGLVLEYLKTAKNPTDIGHSNNILGLSYAIQNNVDSALIYFDISIENLNDNEVMLPRVITNKAILFRNNGDLEQAVSNLILAEGIAKSQNNLEALALIYGEFSSVYSLLSRNSEAIEFTLKAIAILEEEQTDEALIAIEKQKLGNLYLKVKDFEFAHKIYSEILPVLKTKGKAFSYLISVINYAEIVQHFEGKSASVNYLLQNDSLITEPQNVLLNKLYYSKLAKHLKDADENNYFDFFELATELALNHTTTYSLSVVNEHLNSLFERNNYNRIAEILLRQDALLETVVFPLKDLYNYYSLKALYYEKTSNFSAAFNYLNKAQELSIQESSMNNAVLSLEIRERYKNEILLKENLLLQKSDELNRRNNFILLVSLIAVLIIAVLVVFLAVQKRKNIEKQNCIINDKLKLEEELRKFQEKTIKDQKEEVIRLFNTNTLLNEKLAEVKNTLEVEKNQNEALIQLSKIESNEDNWEELIRKLRIVEKDFFNKLIKKFPSLTKKEIDFCALVRIGLEYKQIANILGISHSSVITKKYRITKKLNLDNDLDFQNWILKI